MDISVVHATDELDENDLQCLIASVLALFVEIASNIYDIVV